MTPAELKSLADNWLARSTACGNNGEREQARVYLDCARAITVKALEAPEPAQAVSEATPVPEREAAKEPFSTPDGVF
jgi:hypothetical protein